MESQAHRAVSGLETDFTREDTGIQWEKCKDRLARILPAPVFQAFIRPMILTSDDTAAGSPIFLSLNDENAVRHVELRYMHIIRESLLETELRGQVSLRFAGMTVAAKNSQKQHAGDTGAGLRAPELPIDAQKKDNEPNFYPNTANEIAVQILRELEFPEHIGMIYGPSGCGKTALAKEIVRRYPEKNMARYLSLEGFFTEFLTACKLGSVLAWRSAIRRNKLLVIDDFHFMKKSAVKTQEEIRNLLDEFSAAGKKILFCTETAPAKIEMQKDLESRLRTARLFELFYPEKQIRLKILGAEWKRLNLPEKPEILEYLAEKNCGDVRLLKSCALRLSHRLSAAGEFSWELNEVNEICGTLFAPPSDVGPDKIMAAVTHFFRISREALTGPARDKKYSLARHLFAYLCSELLNTRLAEIAAWAGRRDHTFVLHAKKKIEEMKRKDLFFSHQIEKIKSEILRDSH